MLPKSSLSRRNFIKLCGVFSLGICGQKWSFESLTSKNTTSDKVPGVTIFVFDALSALHLNSYGYLRKTAPNIERFAQKANVYHHHYSAGNFTVPGTASMLNGMYPWTHRGFHLTGLLPQKMRERNLFHLLNDTYHTVTFSQNDWVDNLLNQYSNGIEKHLNRSSYGSFEAFSPSLSQRLNDKALASRCWNGILFPFLGLVGKSIDLWKLNNLANTYSDDYPFGLPHSHNVYFLIKDVFDGVANAIHNFSPGTLSYFHFYFPHGPYTPHKDYVGKFSNDWIPKQKEIHPLSSGISWDALLMVRNRYDEYVTNLDAEFGQLIDILNDSRYLENNYLIVTSDHGELFERGEYGHNTPLLYEPVIRIPLLISSPGQKEGRHFYTPTSNTDLLPTLLHLTNRACPTWVEGALLPGFGDDVNHERAIFSVEAKQNPAHTPITKGTLCMIKENWKLISYLGYSDYYNVHELYNLDQDSDELYDLSKEQPGMLKELKQELFAALENADRPYQKG